VKHTTTTIVNIFNTIQHNTTQNNTIQYKMILNFDRTMFTAATMLLLFVACKADDSGNDTFFCDNSGENCYCSPAEPDNQSFCGGGDESSDVWAQTTCTPYAYKPNTYNLQNGIDDSSCGCAPNCDDPYLDVMSYGAGYQDEGKYVYAGTNVWAANPDPSIWWLPEGSGTKQDYFVFHGCDGAGLQSDCVGDIKYLERIQGLYNDDNLGIVDGKGTVPEDGICGDFDYDRTYCKFVHPGTMRVHENYVGGWFLKPSDWGKSCDPAFGDEGAGCINEDLCKSAASGGWDKSNPLCDNILNIPNNFFNGQHPFADVEGYHFSFVLYPWRCSPSGDDKNNLFSYPSITTNGHKCFVDNEPDPAPLALEIYFGVLTSDKEIKLYRFNSDGDFNVNFINSDSPYSINSVNQGKTRQLRGSN